MPVEIVVEQVLTSLIVGATFVGIAFSPLARALGNRIMHGKVHLPGAGSDDPRVDELADEVSVLRRQIGDMQERLDFTERMLAQARDKGALGPGMER